MAEDKFETLDGLEITRNGIVENAKNYYQEAYEEDLTDVCDFTEGSEIRTIHESIAVEDFNLYLTSYHFHLQNFLKYCGGAYLDTKAYEYGLARKGSSTATGNVTFTLSSTINSDYIIPAGTIILSRSEGYEYELTSNITIAAGTLSQDGTVTSVNTGARYNTEAQTLTAFKDIATLRTEVSVTNNAPITGGVDPENDEEFRTRILNTIKQKTYGTVPTYEKLIKNEVEGIHDIQFVDPTLLTTSTAYPVHYKPGTRTVCTSCVNVIFVNSVSKPVPTSILNNVEYVMAQQDNTVIGHEFHVEAVKLVPIYLHMQLYVNATVPETEIVTVLEAFFNGDEITVGDSTKRYKGLNIGATLHKYQLINILEDIPGVNQVGTITRMKYNTGIPQDLTDSGWIANGDGGYSYTDSQGYTYYKANKSAAYDNWGERNFDSISTRSGTVLTLGNMSEVDQYTTKVIEVEQIVVTE